MIQKGWGSPSLCFHFVAKRCKWSQTKETTIILSPRSTSLGEILSKLRPSSLVIIILAVIAFIELASIYSNAIPIAIIVVIVVLVVQFEKRLRAATSHLRTLETVSPPQEADQLPQPPVYSYTILLPRSTKWESQRALQFVEQLLFAFKSLVFQIIADKNSIQWRIVDIEGREPSMVETAIRASYPEAQITTTLLTDEEIIPNSIFRTVFTYHYTTDVFPAPMLHVDEIGSSDPLAALSQAMTSVQDGERIAYTLAIVESADRSVYKEGRKRITVADRSQGGYLIAPRRDAFSPRTQRIVEDKLRSTLYMCLLLIQFDTPQQERSSILQAIDKQLVLFDNREFAGVRRIEESSTSYQPKGDSDFATSAVGVFNELITWRKQYRRQKGQLPPLEWVIASVAPSITPIGGDPLKRLNPLARLVLEPQEIAALWHLPHAGFSASTIAWRDASQVALPETMKGKRNGVCLGVNRYAGQDELVYITDQDRATHIAIVGKTGAGKSTLLHQLIQQDIYQNKGVAVVDPHGQLVRDILRTSIPPNREGDVVVIDIADDQYPPPLNMLALPSGIDRGSAANHLVALLDKFGSFEDTVTVAPTLRAALLTLWNEQTPTIRDVVRLFTNDQYRYKLIEHVDNPAVEDFWDGYESKSVGQREQLTAPVTVRLSDFYSNTYLYPMMCHPDMLDFASLIRENKIILVSLAVNEGRIQPHEYELLGSILLAQIQFAVMQGLVKQGTYNLYIDEVQRFVTATLAEMFSEVRKYHLSLTVANQFLKQLAGDTLDAIMGTVGAMIVFQCGLDDARALAPYMKSSFTAEDLINLNLHTAAVFMRSNKVTQPVFSMITREPLASPTPTAAEREREQHIRQLSRQRYMPKSREEVLDWLRNRYPRPGKTHTDDDLYDPNG